MSYRFFDPRRQRTLTYRGPHYGFGVIGSSTHPPALTRANGAPVAAHVALYSKNGNRLIAHTHSNANGEWEVRNLP